MTVPIGMQVTNMYMQSYRMMQYTKLHLQCYQVTFTISNKASLIATICNLEVSWPMHGRKLYLVTVDLCMKKEFQNNAMIIEYKKGGSLCLPSAVIQLSSII